MAVSRPLWLTLAVTLAIGVMSAQPPTDRKERPAPTGLKVLGAPVLEPPNNVGGRTVALPVQNVTNKTIVAAAASFQEFRADGVNTYYPPQDAAHGVGMDWDGPSAAELDPDHHLWIRPGQVTSLRLFSTGNVEAASVKVTITGIVYEDLTSEGPQASMFFHSRREDGRKARETAAQEKSPSQKARFTRYAEWYEAHAVEVEK